MPMILEPSCLWNLKQGLQNVHHKHHQLIPVLGHGNSRVNTNLDLLYPSTVCKRHAPIKSRHLLHCQTSPGKPATNCFLVEYSMLLCFWRGESGGSKKPVQQRAQIAIGTEKRKWRAWHWDWKIKQKQLTRFGSQGETFGCFPDYSPVPFPWLAWQRAPSTSDFAEGVIGFMQSFTEEG